MDLGRFDGRGLCRCVYIFLQPDNCVFFVPFLCLFCAFFRSLITPTGRAFESRFSDRFVTGSADHKVFLPEYFHSMIFHAAHFRRVVKIYIS